MADSYDVKLQQEKEFFRDFTDIHELPPIHSYWANKYLLPKLQALGVPDIDSFFLQPIAGLCQQHAFVRIVSLGAGNCDNEVRFAEKLVAAGVANFRIECLDINESMLARGDAEARVKGLQAHVVPVVGDFNAWRPAGKYEGIIANQALHHVVALEHLCTAMHDALVAGGLLVVADMIGRNGHQRWPEALAAVHSFWRELPPHKRYNYLLKRHEELYENWDCSTHGFEGVRAQDILPLLVQHFHFQVFLPWSNVMDVFIDRPFGRNFDPDVDEDRAFIDRIEVFDEREILAGRLTPTHLLAVLSNEPAAQPRYAPGLTPEGCIRRGP